MKVSERRSAKQGLRRSAFVHGQAHIWIYLCNWRAKQDRTTIASSEDDDAMIGRAAARLNGQKLVAVSVQPDEGRSAFEFDLGGTLETWPYDDDSTEEQWIIYKGAETFSYRADGLYCQGRGGEAPDAHSWRPLP